MDSLRKTNPIQKQQSQIPAAQTPYSSQKKNTFRLNQVKDKTVHGNSRQGNFEKRQQPKNDEHLFISQNEARQMEKSLKPLGPIQKKISFKKFFLSFFAVILTILFASAIYFFLKTYLVSKKMNSFAAKTTFSQNLREIVAPILPANKIPLKGAQQGRINILLLGAAGEHKPGGNLTDTVMVMSINTETNKVALLSLPRDFYVKIPETNSFAKINSLYPIGIKENQGADLIKAAVEKITGLQINYYFAIDFDGFKKIIDDIGGINITNDRDIYDPTYPGPNYSYQTFQLSKGFQKLDGETALKYVRERHDDPQGDFGRAKRQQQVIQAVKNKMFSLKTFFDMSALSNVLETLGENIRTDITFEDISGFIALSKKLDLENIDNVVLDAWKSDSLLKVSHIALGNANAFILVPRTGNYSEIQDLAQNIFNQAELKRRANEIAKEEAKIQIVNKSGYQNLSSKIKKLLSENFEMKDIKVISHSEEQTSAATTVADFTNGEKIFTIDELIKKLPARISPADHLSENNEGADIVVTLGSDIVEAYKYEDVSKEEYDKAQDNPVDFDLQNQ